MAHITKGCLVVHGLTGTPAVVSPVTQKLLSSGYRVIAPCLAGHGSTLESLAQTTWEEWYATVRLSYRQLMNEVDRVYYAGVSLGALLGLKLAIDEGWGVRALVLMGAPLRLSAVDRFLSGLVKHTFLRNIIKSVKKDFKKSVADPEGRKIYFQNSLHRIPAQSVFEIERLQNEVQKDISKIANPILLIHGRYEKVAPPSNVERIRRSVSSDIVETWVAKRSRHVVTLDYDKDEVAVKAIEFIERY